MEQTNDKLKEFLKEQIELENKIVETANQTVKDLKNPLIKELIMGIALDSKKHANLIQALIDLLESKTPFIDTEEKESIDSDIREHILLEKKAIATYEKLVKGVKIKEMRLILNYLIEDEKRHHHLLQRIQKLIVEAHTLTEEEWWDIMWKDTLFHGSPLG
ncbi:MAG: ferritin family protein [Candidatus Odinarchaeia archaeon]